MLNVVILTGDVNSSFALPLRLKTSLRIFDWELQGICLSCSIHWCCLQEKRVCLQLYHCHQCLWEELQLCIVGYSQQFGWMSLPLYFVFLFAFSSTPFSCVGGGGIRFWSSPVVGVSACTRVIRLVSFGSINGNLVEIGMVWIFLTCDVTFKCW